MVGLVDSSSFLIISVLTAIITENHAVEVCVKRMSNCDGSELECSRSVPCYYGDCSSDGECLCQRCWTGDNCDQYVDQFTPKFLVPTKYVIVSSDSSGHLLTVRAYDNDAIHTCHEQTPCPCSDIQYRIENGNDDNLFEIEPQMGHVFLSEGKSLASGDEYELVISATSAINAAQDGSSNQQENLQTVTIKANADSAEAKSVLQNDENSTIDTTNDKPDDLVNRDFSDEHRIVKRDTGNANATTFQLQRTDSTSYYMEIGDVADFLLQITIPAGVSMDLMVEIFTADPFTNNATFALCGASFGGKGSAVSSTVASPTPQLTKNNITTTISDHASVDFGDVTTASCPSATDCTISITFKAVLLGNDPYTVSGDNYSIFVGASYNDNNYVWVSQAMIIANVSDPSTYPSSVGIDGPQSIDVGGFATFTMHVFLTTPQSIVEVDVFGVDAPPDSYSTGSIVVKQMGSNYQCAPIDLPFATCELVPSKSEMTMSRASLITPTIINTDSTNRAVANAPQNEIIMQFTLTIANDPALTGTLLPLSTTVMINDRIIWTNLLNITMGNEATGTKGTATMSVQSSSVSGALKGTATVLVDVVIPENAYANVVIQVLAPATAVNPSVITICSISPSSWGSNIPHVQPVEPVFTSRASPYNDQGTVDYGRIWNSAMLPGNQSASTVTLAVTIRLEETTADGQSVEIQLLEAQGGPVITTKTVTAHLDTSASAGDSSNDNATGVDVQMSDLLNTGIMSPDSESAIQMVMSFNQPITLNSVVVEMLGTITNESISARVCRAEVSYVGKKIPCLSKSSINRQVHYSTVDAEHEFINMATMNMESICISKDAIRTPLESRQITISAAFELPQQDNLTAGMAYTFYSGIKMGESMIWVGSAQYTVDNKTTDIFPPGCTPTINASLSQDSPAIAGHLAIVDFRIKIPPQSRSTYKLKVTGVSGVAGICTLMIVYLGDNFPCVDKDVRLGSNSSAAGTTRLSVGQYDNKLKSNLEGVLDFGPLSNLGKDAFSTDDVNDPNTIVVSAFVKLDSSATGSVNLQYEFVQGATVGKKSFSFPLSTETMANSSSSTPANCSLSTIDGTSSIHINLTKIIVLEIQVPESSSPTNITVDFSNPNLAANDFAYCSAAAIAVGSNIPCFNVTDVAANMNNTCGNCSNTLTIPLGLMCRLPGLNDTSEDWLRIEVGVNILNPRLTGSITIQASVTVDGSNTTLNPLSLTVDSTTEIQSSESEAFSSTYSSTVYYSHYFFSSGWNQKIEITLLSNVSVPAAVGVKTWVNFNVSLPKNSTVPLKLIAQGASADNRAIIIITDVKVDVAGINVACIKNTSIVGVSFNTSSAITTKQHDLAVVDFGYVTNLGFSHRQGYDVSYHNMITISVQVIMTDHPLADQNKEFPLNITVETDTQTTTGSQMLAVIRNGTEKPHLQVTATVLNPKLFNPLDAVQIRFLASHTDYSTAEPTSTQFRLHLPKYMNFSTGSLVSNVSGATVSYGNFVALVLTGPFLFQETIDMNFILIVDPYDFRRPGSLMVNATSFGRTLATMVSRTVNGATYPPTTDYAFSGNAFHFIYAVTAEGCYSPLGMQSGAIQNCQLSGSTSVDANSGPENARFGGPSGTVWKPALRDNSYKNFLQVDFGNRTRVAKIAFQKDSCCRAATSVYLQYSEQGVHWINGQTNNALNYSVDDTAMMELAMPFDGRHLRIFIDGTDKPENADTMYIGIRVEFYGCILEEDTTTDAVCANSRKTIQSNDPSQYRHFSVDANSNAVFACDIRASSWMLNCFCSPDGTLWKSMPDYISNVVGYDKTNGVTYARNSQNTTIFKSSDCITWLMSTEAELVKAQSGEFVGSEVVAGLAKNDPSVTKTLGKWKANYDGMFLSDIQKLGWS